MIYSNKIDIKRVVFLGDSRTEMFPLRAFFPNNLYCLNSSNGGEIWRTPINGWARSNARVMGKMVVFGADDNKLYGIDKNRFSPSIIIVNFVFAMINISIIGN